MRRPCLLVFAASLLTLALAGGAAAAPLAAQKPARVPKRPTLPAAADTNDAVGYYTLGVTLIHRRPDLAADAFYWASRLNPAWADPLYARRIALHLTDKDRLLDYVVGKKFVVERKDVIAIDSLDYFAAIRSPFVYRVYDKLLFDEVIDEVSNRVNDGESILPLGWGMNDPHTMGWLAYSAGDFRGALAQYAKALAKRPNDLEIHEDRANAFYQMNAFDSALAEVNTLLAEMRKRDEKKLVYAYQSKAMYEYAVGVLQAQLGRYDEARAAYGRSLTEDLGFYMAHARLGAVALLQKDTAAALREYDLAVQLRGDDGALRFTYGVMLMAANQVAAAAAQFQKAIELEPYYPPSYYYLGRILDGSGYPAEAAAQYEQFAARAVRGDAQAEWARKRAAELRAAK